MSLENKLLIVAAISLFSIIPLTFVEVGWDPNIAIVVFVLMVVVIPLTCIGMRQRIIKMEMTAPATCPACNNEWIDTSSYHRKCEKCGYEKLYKLVPRAKSKVPMKFQRDLVVSKIENFYLTLKLSRTKRILVLLYLCIWIIPTISMYFKGDLLLSAFWFIGCGIALCPYVNVIVWVFLVGSTINELISGREYSLEGWLYFGLIFVVYTVLMLLSNRAFKKLS